MVERDHIPSADGALLAILKSSPLAIVSVSTKGVVTMWNPAAERMFGWAAAETLGGPLPCIPPEDMDNFAAVFATVLSGQAVEALEVQRLHKDGRHIDVSLSLAPLPDDHGHIAGAVGVLGDISDRKAEERARQEGDRLLRLALARGQLLAGRLDLETGVVSWIGGDSEILFGDRAPSTFAAFLELVHPEDRTVIVAALAERPANAIDVEFRLISANGSVRWLTARGLVVEHDTSKRGTALGVFLDTTERRRQEQELSETSETLRAIIAASPTAITTTDVDGRVTMWSSAAEEMFGWSAEHVLGGPLPFIPNGDSETLEDLRARVLAGEIVVDQEAERRRYDGTRLTVSLSLAPLRDAEGDVSGIVGLLTDISERKRSEAEIAARNAELSALQESLVLETTRFNEELRESARDLELLYNRERDTRETLSAIVAASPVALVATDMDRRVTMWNPAAERMFGWSAEEVLLGPAPHLPPDTLAAEELRDRALSGEVILDEHAVRVRKDGSAIDVSLSLAPLQSDGEVAGVLSILADVTERVTAERQLYEAEERYRSLVEQIPAVVYLDVADGEGTTLYVSPQIEKFLGVSQEDWTQEGLDIWLEHIHPDDRAHAMSAYLRTVKLGEPLAIEYRVVRTDDSVLWFRDQAQVLSATETRPAQLHGVMLDITELKDAQAEIARSLEQLKSTDLERRRLLSLLVSSQEAERRRIASDMHDDTIQAMTAVGLRLAVLRGQLEKPREAPSPQAFDELELTVGAAIGRLRRLLFELRPSELDRGGLASALAIQLEQSRSDVEIDFRLENRLTTEPSSEARTVAYRIAQEALANVRRHAGATFVEVTLESEDDGALVRVRDDGQGFVVEDAFERPASGHLGLIAMRERAELAGGWLRVSSEPGAGTTVEFWIPRSFEPLEEEPGS